jgi:hypothetical protein
MFIGLVTWAGLRGRGGFAGLLLFALFGTLAAFVGGLAAQAISSSASDGLTGLGVVAGAGMVTLVGAIGFGSQGMVPAKVSGESADVARLRGGDRIAS